MFMSKALKTAIAVLVVVVVAGGAGVWYFVLRDTAEQEANLAAIGTPATPGATTAVAGAQLQSVDGSWKVKQDTGVFVGYRMDELFAGQTVKKTATGRTPAVEGTMTVVGRTITRAEVQADLKRLKSDEERRDAQLTGRGLQISQFPQATFKLTTPVALPDAPKSEQEVAVTAKGDLTLHGVTKPVEVAVKATWDGTQIKVAGSTPIALADYGIEKVDVPGFVSIDDQGTLELQLLFVKA
jgi:polyisoprenoid-binding protein YceI